MQIESIRGNIDTRIRKLEEEGFDAILLAAAGLHRMGWADRITSYLPEDVCIPAVGQGALGIECRGGDSFMLGLLGKYQHEETARCVAAERTYLRTLQGGCQVPIGAYARVDSTASNPGAAGLPLTLTGIVGSPDGGELLRQTVAGTEPERLGTELADYMLMHGADRLLADSAAQTQS